MPTGPCLKDSYDILVIGGGVHGAAVALEATMLGHEVLLVDRQDFCAGVSANSLKIIHGGLRYLQTADLRRSRESAREQAELLRRAPHLVKPLACVMGTERSWMRGRLAVSLGLWFYERVIRAGLGQRQGGGLLSREQALERAGFDAFEGCTGAALWHDGQVIDSERLVLTYLLTAERAGAQLRNYLAVTGVETRGGEPLVSLRDAFTGQQSRVTAWLVIDTGSLLSPHACWARAVNLVIDRRGGGAAVGRRLRNETLDSERLFFSAPLGGRSMLGTWYFADRNDKPNTLTREEFGRCLEDARRFYVDPDIGEQDVALVHVGRLPVSDPADPLSLLDKPVIRTVGGDKRLISVTGAKYTTARPTAIRALRAAGMEARADRRHPPWYGVPDSSSRLAANVRGGLQKHVDSSRLEPLASRLVRQYGQVAELITGQARVSVGGFEMIPGVDGLRAELEYCMDREYCKTAADFICRRSGIGSLGRPAPSTVAYCIEVMARHLGWDDERVDAEHRRIAAHYQTVVREPS